MIVMGLGGLWHGAGLSYLAWGLMHGLLLVLERPVLGRLASVDIVAFRLARMTIVFVCVTMLWIFFKLPNFDHAVGYLAGMFTPSTIPKMRARSGVTAPDGIGRVEVRRMSRSMSRSRKWLIAFAPPAPR